MQYQLEWIRLLHNQIEYLNFVSQVKHNIKNKENENQIELNTGITNTLRLKSSNNRMNGNSIAIHQNNETKIDLGSKSNLSSNVNLAISDCSEEKKLKKEY